MNETYYQELYNDYAAAKTDTEKKNALKKIHELIYLYPVKRWRASADTASDFYIYLFHQIEDIVESYQGHEDITFLTWFSYRMKGRYLNFIRMKKRALRNEEEYAMVYASNDRVFDREYDHDATTKSEHRAAGFLRRLLKQLEESEEIIIRLYYGFTLRMSLFRKLARKYTVTVFFSRYRTYLQIKKNYRESEKKAREKLLETMIKIERKIQRDTASEKEHLQLQNLTREFFAARPAVRLKNLAALLEENISGIHRQIKRGLAKLKKIFENKNQAAALNK